MSKKKSETSGFGVSERVNHDSSKFYKSRLYNGMPKEAKESSIENSIDEKYLNKIFCKSSENMEELSTSSIHLAITSPPYGNKEYDKDLTLQEHLDFLRTVFCEVKRVLVPGGRFCINLADLGRKPWLPISAYISLILIDLGFLLRGEIIWIKKGVSGSSCAWGSWRSASNPVLRDCHEKILICCKDNYKRASKGKISTITRDEFLEYTKSTWEMSPASAKQIGHPAPFCSKLSDRLIKLYSFQSDIILDPFMGSGTTAVSAIKLDRSYIGYEINSEYVELAEKRISQGILSKSARV
jgi:modification methylase